MKGERPRLRVALCQIDTSVGDIANNGAKVVEYLSRAESYGANLALFPELAISGYPPEDLLLKRHFLSDCKSEIGRVSGVGSSVTAVVGYPELDSESDCLYNSLALIDGKRVLSTYRKALLPNYGVFDEKRYFKPGRVGATVGLGSLQIGLSICEDIWHLGFPVEDEVKKGATVIVNISASPYHQGKGHERQKMLSSRARKYGCYILFCNTVGGQDELVFDGHSLVIGPDGEVVCQGKQFQEDLIVCDLQPAVDERPAVEAAHDSIEKLEVESLANLNLRQPKGDAPARDPYDTLEPIDEVYRALIVGSRDYIEKNRFERVVIGLSGGIDSSLVACIATDAIGPERVTGVVMPSPYSSSETQSDARKLAQLLGIALIDLSIKKAMVAYESILENAFAGTSEGIAEENIQARIRGNLLMALSNKFGWLVLTTGNKSEYSVGYTTLYGDMAGGFAVLKDVPKTLVFQLARFRNGGDGRPIPESVIARPPSAELRSGQRDQDTLPPYETLDPILEAYVELDQSEEEIVEKGFDPETVGQVIGLVDSSEYKRRQAPPGVKIRPKAFGRDRRFPITNLYRG